MRKDWDYVSFKDYLNDTNELTSHAVGIIQQLVLERDQARSMFLAAVKAVGGTLEIPVSFLQEGKELDWESRDCPEHMTRIYRIVSD